MKKKWLLVGMTLFLMPWLLASCGIAQELYDAVVAERDSLAAKLQSVQGELDAAKSKVQSVQSELDTSKLELESVSGELDSTKSELESVQSELDSVQNKFTATESELQSVQSELGELGDELAEIKKVYPPRDFSSTNELREWLISNTVSEMTPSKTIQDWFAKALKIQEDALKDGYIISAEIDYNEQTGKVNVICAAIIDGEYWGWDPEIDEPVYYPGLGKVIRY